MSEEELVPTIYAIETLEATGEVRFVTALKDGCYAILFTVTQEAPAD